MLSVFWICWSLGIFEKISDDRRLLVCQEPWYGVWPLESSPPSPTSSALSIAHNNSTKHQRRKACILDHTILNHTDCISMIPMVVVTIDDSSLRYSFTWFKLFRCLERWIHYFARGFNTTKSRDLDFIGQTSQVTYAFYKNKVFCTWSINTFNLRKLL